MIRATAAPRAFFSASTLGHLRIKREKRDTCPICSFLPPLWRWVLPATHENRETRSRTNVPPQPCHSDVAIAVAGQGLRFATACKTVATFANSLPASPAFLAFSFARATLLWRCTAMGGGQVQIYQTGLHKI